ncbi:hypothetical protein P3T24_004379 [Paraburkholderia sp. GAS33]
MFVDPRRSMSLFELHRSMHSVLQKMTDPNRGAMSEPGVMDLVQSWHNDLEEIIKRMTGGPQS